MNYSPKSNARGSAQATQANNTGILHGLLSTRLLFLLSLFTLGAFYCSLLEVSNVQVIQAQAQAHAARMETHAHKPKYLKKESLLAHGKDADVAKATEPDWLVPFWSPVDMNCDGRLDPLVTLCKINFREYSRTPHLYPMFREVEKLSNCKYVCVCVCVCVCVSVCLLLHHSN